VRLEELVQHALVFVVRRSEDGVLGSAFLVRDGLDRDFAVGQVGRHGAQVDSVEDDGTAIGSEHELWTDAEAERFGAPSDPARLRRVWYWLMAEAGVRRMTPYTASRHAAGSYLGRAGVSPMVGVAGLVPGWMVLAAAGGCDQDPDRRALGFCPGRTPVLDGEVSYL